MGPLGFFSTRAPEFVPPANFVGSKTDAAKCPPRANTTAHGLAPSRSALNDATAVSASSLGASFREVSSRTHRQTAYAASPASSLKMIWAPPCSAPRTAANAPLPPLTPASPPPSSESESESESESSDPEMEETSSPPPCAIMASNSSSVSGARPCLRRLALYLPRSDLRASRCSRAEAKPWSRQASMRPTRGPRAAPATSSNGSSPARCEGLAPCGPVASSSSSSSSPGRRSATGAPRRLSTRVGAGAAHIVLIAAEGGGRDSPRGSRAAR